MGTKYTGLFVVPALAVCCAFVVVNRGELNRTIGIRNLCVRLAIAAAVASPFYLRNWILLGCPIYPPPSGYAPFCSPKYFAPQAIEQFHNYIYRRGAGLGHDWLDFLKLPFNLTYLTANFHGAGGIGLCLLGLAPFGIIVMRENTFARSLALFCIVSHVHVVFATRIAFFNTCIRRRGHFFRGGMELCLNSLRQASAAHGNHGGRHFNSCCRRSLPGVWISNRAPAL